MLIQSREQPEIPRTARTPILKHIRPVIHVVFVLVALERELVELGACYAPRAHPGFQVD